MRNSASEAIQRHRQRPWLLNLRSSTLFIIATVWMSTFTDFLLYAMIVPVMPTALMARAGIPYGKREYWVSALLMCEAGTSLLLCPVFGYLIDRIRTRKLPFIGALITLAGCMVILHMAQSLAIFIIGRLLQGCAGALVAVAAFALINDSVPSEHLGQTIGYLGSAIASGYLLGPFLGGVIYHAAGYNAVFWVAYAIIATDLVLRVAMIEKKAAAAWTQCHEMEGHTIASTVPVTESTAPREPGPSPRRNAGLALFRMLRQRRVLISSGAILVQGILLSAFDATLSIFVQTRYGWSALGMGLIFLPMAIPAFFEPLFGFVTDRCGVRFIAFGCFFLLSPALICLRFTEIDSVSRIALLVILLFLIGVCLHACAPAMYVETQQALITLEREQPGVLGPKGAVAQGFGLQSMCQFAGVFFGPLWGGFVEYRFGWGAMTGTLGVIAALTAMPMLWLGDDREINADEDHDGERQDCHSDVCTIWGNK